MTVTTISWRERAVNWIRSLSLGTTFSADDLTAAVGVPDPDHTANSRASSVGSVFTGAQAAGMIEFTGQVVRSTSKHRKGGAQRVWRRVDVYGTAPALAPAQKIKVMKRRPKTH